MSFQPPKGTDDTIAPRSQAWRDALRAWEDWSGRYGYTLVATPVFESTELFERGVGDTSEVVIKQMYTFSDRGGRSLTLRPEGTAGVVRAYLNAGIQGVWKGAYSGPFFRYERPQAGRRRQFWQLGVEYLDSNGPLADVEVIELGHRYIGALGVPHLETRVNSIGDSACRPGYVQALRDFLEGVRHELSQDSRSLIERNPLRVLDSKVDRAVVADAPRTVEHLCADCRSHYEGLKDGLTALGVPFVEDANLVRGLDYYTRTAFEYVATGLDAAQNAVGGGGRYDGLAEAIGGRSVPGVGFALGLDRIMLSLGDPESTHLDAFLVSENDPGGALAAASYLRGEGLRVDLDTDDRSVKAQFRAARRAGAPVILVWRGRDGPLDVQTEDERVELALEEVADWVRR